MVLGVNLIILLIVLFYTIDNFILDEELVAKALRIFGTCVLANISFCRKLFSSLASATIFNENFKVFLVTFFIPDF